MGCCHDLSPGAPNVHSNAANSKRLVSPLHTIVTAERPRQMIPRMTPTITETQVGNTLILSDLQKLKRFEGLGYA